MTKKIASIIFIVLLVASLLAVFSACQQEESEKDKISNIVDFVLEVDAGRDVKILQLTDIQIIDSSQCRTENRLSAASKSAWAPQNIENLAWRFTREAVAAAKPDLIVLSGDNVYGEFDDSGVMLQALIAEMDSYNIPWAITFGNHDNETAKGIEWTCEQYANAKNCLFSRGDVASVEGNGNYNIAIVQGGKVTEIVWLMESHGKSANTNILGTGEDGLYRQEGFRQSQLVWFTNQNRIIADALGYQPKSIGFSHHPLLGLGLGMEQYGYCSPVNGLGEGSEFNTGTIPADNSNGDFGALNYDNKYIDNDLKFHELLKKYSCEGWFFGHEHTNYASVLYEGVRYTYGLKASQYDEYIADKIGGTLILVGQAEMATTHLYTKLPDKV